MSFDRFPQVDFFFSSFSASEGDAWLGFFCTLRSRLESSGFASQAEERRARGVQGEFVRVLELHISLCKWSVFELTPLHSICVDGGIVMS